MKENIMITIVAGLLSFYLASCDGGGGEGEAFTVFDVIVDVQEIEGHAADCPKNAYIKLSLILDENEISGHAELSGFGKLGKRAEISGIIEDDSFSLQEFEVRVLGPVCSHGKSSLSYSFIEFDGVLLSDPEDESASVIEGSAAGYLFFNRCDAVLCSGTFTGQFSGEARTPEGCLGISELVAVDKYRDCPAVAISNLCDGDSWFCGLPAPPPLVADGYIDNSCDALDCHSVVNCESSPDLTNLQIGPGLSGNVLLPDGGMGEPIYGCTSFD